MDINLKCLYPLIMPQTNANEFIAMDYWLWDNVGEEDIDFEWALPADYILFAREEDKIMFILRWL